jgi:hypothetical protein
LIIEGESGCSAETISVILVIKKEEEEEGSGVKIFIQ